MSDFRKWFATKTIRLRIYQKGFTYESKGQIEICRWDQIKNIDFKTLEIHHKHSAPTRVRVIRSVEGKDGTVIKLAETLNLLEISKLITQAKQGLG